MTDNEVVSDFEIILNDLKDRVGHKTYETLKQSFDLINRQKAEIKEKDEIMATQADVIKTLERALQDKTAEIERLEDKLEEKSAEIKTLIPTIDRLMKVNKAEVIEHLKKINFNAFPKEILNAIKSEARREFAERLKKKQFTLTDIYTFIWEVIKAKDVDNLLKEMEREE